MILIEQPLIIVFKAFKEIKEISHLQTYAAKSLQLCQTLCDPIDSSLPGSPIPGILQARILEWTAISFSKKVGNFDHKYLNTAAAAAAAAKSLQSCPTLCYPLDSSPPGCPVPEILQARTLEWAANSSSNA